jgi:hypothetical protein
MKPLSLLLGAAIVACLAFALPTQDARQDDTAKKIENLTKSVETLTKALEAEKRRASANEKRLDQIEAWFLALRAACESFDASANEARKNGFEAAGANPLSKSNVLDGMKKFASDLTRTAPSPQPAPR